MKVFVVLASALALASAYKGPEHHAVIGKDGVPVDTAEVQHARAAHLAQVAAAETDKSYHHPESAIISHNAEYTGPLYHGPKHIPILDKHGVPVETPEVQHAKAAHLAQVATAKTHKYKGTAAVAHVEHKIPTYHGPQHIAVIGKDGVPVDTADVQHARAAHLATHASQKHH